MTEWQVIENFTKIRAVLHNFNENHCIPNVHFSWCISVVHVFHLYRLFLYLERQDLERQLRWTNWLFLKLIKSLRLHWKCLYSVRKDFLASYGFPLFKEIHYNYELNYMNFNSFSAGCFLFKYCKIPIISPGLILFCSDFKIFTNKVPPPPPAILTFLFLLFDNISTPGTTVHTRRS